LLVVEKKGIGGGPPFHVRGRKHRNGPRHYCVRRGLQSVQPARPLLVIGMRQTEGSAG
jgi:hypothetical protein